MSTIGIVAALHHEIAALLEAMGPTASTRTIGRRDYYSGELYGHRCVVVLARVGKVAAAATTVTLIREFSVRAIVFTGLAGAISTNVKIGDIVVATSLMQHDMDASPLFPRHEVPLLGCSRFTADSQLTRQLTDCSRNYLANDLTMDVSVGARSRFGLEDPKVHEGLIISGDRFVNDPMVTTNLRRAIPDAMCVEMEGAAVAQICYEYDVPYAIMRTISDRADGSASLDFSSFLVEVASVYSAGVMRGFLESLATQTSTLTSSPTV